MAKAPRVVIIGAGIGGLAAARTMLARGFDVQLYDKAPQLGEVGAGLQIGPNAAKVLDVLGLTKKFRELASLPDCMATLRWDDGSIRHREPFQESFVRFGAPYATMHRADLHGLLLEGIPDDRIHLDRCCIGVRSNGDRAVATFADGSNAEGDIVIGADGIRSAVREALWGQGRPRYTHYLGWRGVLPVKTVVELLEDDRLRDLHRKDVVIWRRSTGIVLFYPMRRGELLNVFAGRYTDEWAEESWTVPSTRAELLAAFEGWNERLLAVLGRLDEVHKWGIFDRAPLASWTKGRISLLGDAAHPMMPTLAQGAGIAIEDAFALARQLERHRDDPAAGLAAYAAERIPRATKVQLMAREQFELNRRDPPPPPLSRDWIFAHDVTADQPATI